VAYKTWRVESLNGITVLILNRPQTRNAINNQVIDELHDLVASFRNDTATRAIILTGASKVFCDGMDSEMLTRWHGSSTPDETRAEILRWRRAFDAFANLPQMTIAAINGHATGVAIALALACDFRLASTRALFSLPEVRTGLVMAFGVTQRLTRLIGTSATKEIILRGRNVTAIDAQRMSLVHRIAEPGDLMGLARSWAERMCEYPASSLTLAKQLIDHADESTADASAYSEATAFAELFHTSELVTQVEPPTESEDVEPVDSTK
jgi:enoyl-CoA hydratase